MFTYIFFWQSRYLNGHIKCDIIFCCIFVGYMQRGGSMRGEELAQQTFATKTAAKKVTNVCY